ncbi:hypothetical protein [Azospirillum sp. TSO22-1]|uniref:hypothetical protein n=1 Tax=Azospirillum sp. TSO22-1 TaxID=716789 RepID=UPI001304F91F|nr:hypothetical protein [Azospirillum sp. TSO22-1]
MDIIAALDDAARTLGEIRIFRHHGAVREDIACHRDTLNAVRRQLDAARAAP